MASGKTYARAAAAIAGMLLAVPVLMAQPAAPVKDNAAPVNAPVTLVTAVPADTPVFYALGEWSLDDDDSPVYYTASSRDTLLDSSLFGMPGFASTASLSGEGLFPNAPVSLHKA